MSTQSLPEPQYEYNSRFSLLISKTPPGGKITFTDYTLFLFSFLREAELHPVRNVIITSPDLPKEFSEKLHIWFNNYIIPQFNHLGVVRIAIVTGPGNNRNKKRPVFCGIKPEIGLFSSMPEAKAWITGLFNQSETTERPVYSRFHPACKYTG